MPQKVVMEIPANPMLGDLRKRKRKLRVAAYCRVSTEEEEQQNSFEVQVDYYTEKITHHDGWQLAGIFADDGISGVRTKKRDQFNEMIELCRKKKIDLILTKSISRFARIIRMTADNLKFLRENYPNQNLSFIRNNIERYIDIMDDDLFLQEELLEILAWDISDELKIKLLEFSRDTISVIGKNYSTSVCLYILNNNLMNSDLMALFSSFEQWDDPIQTKIFDYAVSNITDIIDNPDDVSEKLKSNLLCTDKLNKDIRIDLLIAIMPSLSEGYIKEILALLDLTNYIKIFDTRSRPKFAINDESEKLLTAFKEKGLICNYEEIQDKEEHAYGNLCKCLS